MSSLLVCAYPDQTDVQLLFAVLILFNNISCEGMSFGAVQFAGKGAAHVPGRPSIGSARPGELTTWVVCALPAGYSECLYRGHCLAVVSYWHPN